MPPIAFNDNQVPAGTLVRGVLTVSLVARQGMWKPYGPDGDSLPLFVFGEAGKALQGAEFWLVHAGAPVQWTPIAKDGHALPPWQTAMRTARQAVSIGETYDFRVQAPDTGSVSLELRKHSGALIASQVLRFQRP